MAPPKFGSVPAPDQEQYFKYPLSVFKLNKDLHAGMYPLGVLGAISIIATTGVLSNLIWQMIRTRNRKEYRLYRRQLYILYFNLLIADFLQAVSFLFSFHWAAIDAILAPTGACWAQGWLLHLGDMSSGFFVFAIALHTWVSVVKWRREVSYRTFVICVLSVWGFCVLIASLPPIIRGKNCYVKSAAWCWINVAYEADRLWSHYIWIFIFEFGTVLMYVSIAFKLRKHLRFFKSVSGRSSTLERQQKYMMIYPTIYVILTLPLAASRMWSMAHHGKAASDAVMITAGCLITSCGWMDSLMYSLTRNVLASRSTPRNGTAGYGSHGTGPRPGAAPVAGRNRTRYEFDDLTILRSYGDWDGDGDTTPPGTTTMIVGGKEVGGDVRNYSRQADRAKVNKTKRNCSPPSNGRSNSKNPFSRHGSNNKHGTRVTEEELRPVSEGDEKLIDSQKDELVLPIQRPGMAARGESGRSSPMRLSPPLDEPYYVARAQSPASDETRVPSGDHGYPLPPGSPAFGQVRIEKSITVTSSEAADHV